MNLLQQFSKAFQAAPGATLIANPRGQILFANEALCTLFEYAPGELAGKKVEVLIPEQFRASHPELLEAYMQLPSSRSMGLGRDLFGLSKSGRRIPIEIGLNHVREEDQSCVVATVLDLTALKKEVETTRLAIDAASSAMIMTDQTGIILLANSQTSALFGYDNAEMIGAPIETLIAQSLHNKHRVYRTSYAADPSKRSMAKGRELNGCRKDGSEFPVEISLSPVDNHGELLIMATVIDISERKRAESEIQQKNADLLRLNDDLTQFAYSASHDLKAPLSTIEGLLTCIEEDLADGDLDAVQDNTVRARDLTKHLKGLIEDILGLARAEHLDEAFSEVDISEVVNSVFAVTAERAAAANITLSLCDPDKAQAMTQPTRLRQALENLIHNAVHYADQNKPERFVRVTASVVAQRLLLEVSDNGIGIPKKEQDKVFKLFNRFSNHQRSGSGLGLALVKQHVDRLQGEIRFTSNNSGTTFHIDLPATAAEVQ